MLPFVTLTASSLITHEILNPILLGGAALVLAGVVVGVLFRSNGRNVEAEPEVKPTEGGPAISVDGCKSLDQSPGGNPRSMRLIYHKSRLM